MKGTNTHMEINWYISNTHRDLSQSEENKYMWTDNAFHPETSSFFSKKFPFLFLFVLSVLWYFPFSRGLFQEKVIILLKWHNLKNVNFIYMKIVYIWPFLLYECNKNHWWLVWFQPENIMCHTRTSHQIKLIDFGLAQKINPDSPVRVLFGTPEFIPPEIINYEPIGVESDMWSVGVICYVL